MEFTCPSCKTSEHFDTDACPYCGHLFGVDDEIVALFERYRSSPGTTRLYHDIALSTLTQIARQKRGSAARRLARATLDFLESQGDDIQRGIDWLEDKDVIVLDANKTAEGQPL